MWEFLQTTEARAVLLVWGLAMLAIAGYYLVRRFRGFTGDDTPDASELLTNFREMHLEGDIGEEEYRKIKTKMGQRLNTELNEKDQSDSPK